MPVPRLSREALVARLAGVFRRYGYEGASLAHIGEATGLGKGSLYNAFPGGKAEMAEAVLADVEAWFAEHVFAPLEGDGDPRAAVEVMFAALRRYFAGGRRICLPGAFALDATRDRFSDRVEAYFRRWHDALTANLARAGLKRAHAERLAAETLAAVQGGLVLARALDEPDAFEDALMRQEARLAALVGAKRD